MNRRSRIHELARSLESGLRKLSEPTSESRLETAFEVIETYERLSGEVYTLRSASQSSQTPEHELREGEDILAQTATDILRIGSKEKSGESAYGAFIGSYRRIWRRHLGLFYFVLTIFLANCFLGWNIGANEPDYAVLIVGQGMMETIHDHRAWFESIQGNSALEGARIAWNNIRVSLLCFSLGALLGLGGLYILAFNGLLFGCVFGYCYKNNFHEPLLNFVVSHGPLELTIIIASCFAGMLIGRAFYVRPFALMRPRLAAASIDAAVVCLGIIPWLCLAAAFEGFISPYKMFSFPQKMVFGLSLAGIFWAWTFGGIKPDETNAAVRRGGRPSSSSAHR